jgi:hypothetical protein
MKIYRFDNFMGIVVFDEKEKLWYPAMQLIGGTRKFRSMCGKLLSEKLNQQEIGQNYSKQKELYGERGGEHIQDGI